MKYGKSIISMVFMILLGFTTVSFSQETTGNIEGTVKDSSGAVVPGITVTVRSTGSSTAFRRNVTTKDDGSFSLQQIPPGSYEAVTEADKGFGSAALGNIFVVLGKTTPVNLVVTPGDASATVNITSNDSAQLDTTDQKIQTNITRQEIESVPAGTRFTSLLKIAPAVRIEPTGGGIQIDGASGSENTFIIDGQEVTNFRTGVLDSNNNIPLQFIQEVQVKSSGFEAEYGGATGGVINIVTRGGNNDFHGEVGISFQPADWQADPRPILRNYNADADGSNRFEQFQFRKDGGTNFFPSATLGGPIVKDRIWFLGSYAPQYFNTDRTIDYFDGNDPSTRKVVESLSYRQRQLNYYGFGRIDAAPTDKIRISASYTWNPIDIEGQVPGRTAGFSAVDQAQFPDGSVRRGPAFQDFRGGRQSSNNTSVQGNWLVTENIVINARYGYSFLNEKLGNYGIPPVGAPFILCSASSINIPAEAGCEAGNSFGSQAAETRFDVSTRNTFDIDGAFFVNLGGRHSFKVGYQENRLANRASSDNTPVILLRYGRTIASLSSRPLDSTPGAIGAGFLQRFGLFGDVSSKNQAFYVQDKYQPFTNLTLSLGLRIEKEDVPSFAEGLPGINFGWGDKITPRLGGAYDLTGDGKTKVFANFGWFYDRFKYELPRGSFGGNFFRRDYFEIFAGDGAFTNFTIGQILGSNVDVANGNCPTPGGIPNSSGRTRCQRDFRSPSNTPGDVLAVGGIDPDLKAFRQTEFTVGFEREIIQNYVFSSRYTHKQVDRAVEDLGFINSANSEVFLIGNPGIGLAEQTFLDAGLIPLKAKRDYDALELRVDKRLSDNFYFNGSYTYSRLFGNYGGLASSDENGRNSPNVNRNFDSPIAGFTGDGQTDNGRLGTDRPHVFKLFGGYNVNWSGSNTTEFSGFTSVQSGTPITTRIDVLGVATVPLTRRGDQGRTETFTETDFGVRHKYKFGRDAKFTLIGELDILNLFDEANELGVFEAIAPGLSFSEGNLNSTGTSSDPALNFLRAFQSESFVSQINSTISATDSRDIRYLQPNSFQPGRTIRFGARLVF